MEQGVQDLTGGGYMDWWTSLAITFTLLFICFIDSNAVLQLQQFFHDLSKTTCHLYLALLQLRRAATHFADCVRHLASHVQQRSSLHSEFTDYRRHLIPDHEKQSSSLPGSIQDQPLVKQSKLHFLEGVCVLFEMVPSLMSAALTLLTAFSHIVQGGFYILAAMLRTAQVNLFSHINEKEKWDKEQLKAKEKEKKEFQHAAVHPNVVSGSCQCFKNKKLGVPHV